MRRPFVSLPQIGADVYEGNLVGKEITVNVPEYGSSFGCAFSGSPFNLYDVFTVVAQTEFQGERWIGFMNDAGYKGASRAERFFVLDV